MTEREVLEQSRSAMSQWEPIWRKNAIENNKIYTATEDRLTDLLFKGKGKNALVLAFGHSFEKNLKIITEQKETAEFDVVCVDKCLKYIDFIPEYVVCADAQVSTEWLEGKDTSNSTLIINVCANPEWAKQWKGRVIFYVNQDNIETQKIFGAGGGLSDVAEMIPAASNVGNCAVVMASTIFDYDLIMLSGYDFCFSTSYYAFHEEQSEKNQNKKYWMNHRTTLNLKGDIVQTSENLLFSAKWLQDFLTTTRGNIVNTTQETILQCPSVNLEKQLKISKHRELTLEEKENIIHKRIMSVPTKGIEELNKLLKQGHDIYNIVVNIVPKELKWLNLKSLKSTTN